MRNLAIDSQPKNIEIVQNYAKSEVKSDITSETNGIKNDDKNGLKLDFIEVKTEKITESGSKNETITLKPDQIAENGIRTSPVDENIENMFNLASPAPTAQSPGEPPATALAPADDAEGFYAFRAGDLLDGRYKALRFKGTGVFSSVFLVADAVSGGRRCVKVARSLDAMRQTALREAALLKKLQSKEMDEVLNFLLKLKCNFVIVVCLLKFSNF